MNHALKEMMGKRKPNKYDLDRLLKDNQYNITHRGRIFRRIMDKFPCAIESFSDGGKYKKSDITFKPDMYPSVLLAVQSTKKDVTIQGPGSIYAFLSSMDEIDGTKFQWMKIGVTSDHVRRLKEYYGPQEPRTIIGVYAVEHMKLEEDNLMTLLDKLFDKSNREWYKIDDVPLVESLIKKLYRNKMKIV